MIEGLKAARGQCMSTKLRAMSVLKPGESRIIHELPCPPDWMSHTNQFWQLRRAAKHLLHSKVQGFSWMDEKWRDGWQDVLEAVEMLRQIATLQPTKPISTWVDGKLGTTYEICCPHCQTIFEWKGKFYAPQCPECHRWLQESRHDSPRPDA